ncbi:DMT family transporter [Thalassospira lucentensis]|uniref:DMT family transporter n=1 Tax=Thalassospira lucentensis TaxID=168935 RepID=UPI003D2F3E9B
MNQTRPNLALELTLLAVLATLWGGSYVLIKIAVAEIPPLTLIGFRVGIAALFLCGLVIWQAGRFPRDGNTWRKLFTQSVFNSLGAWTVLAWGQQFVDSGLASVLNSTSPVFVYLFTLVFVGRSNAGPFKLLGALLGITGVVLIVGPGVLAGLGDQVAGQLAILAGAVLYAGAALYGRQLSHLSPGVSAAGTMIWASVFLIPTSIIIDRPWNLSPSIDAVLAAVTLGVFCTAFALLIYFRLLRTLGSMGVASQSYLRAGIGVLLGVGLLGEPLTLSTLAGIFCAILGVIAINLAPVFSSSFHPPAIEPSVPKKEKSI